MAILEGYKTYIAGAVGVIIGICEMAGIDVVPGVDANNALALIITSIQVNFLRAALAAK